MSVPLSLSGKVALITGGSRGIGAATVRMFAAAGAKVVFSYQKARAQAESLAKECGAANCHAIASNLDSVDSARALVADAVKIFGRLDILVANHGVWPAQDVAIDKMTDEQWRSTLAINLDAVFGLVKHTVAQMKVQPRTELCRWAYCADQFHQRAARRSVPLRLLCQQGCADQHDEKPCRGTGPGWNLCEQRCPGLGGYRYVETGAR